MAYYNYDRICSYNACFNFILTNRGYGKSYGAKKRAITRYKKYGEQFVYVRRYKSELKKVGMFFGTYQRNLDNKFRLQLPNKLVKEMPEHFYLLRGFEGALSIYEEKDFQKYLSSLEKMSFLEEKARTYMRLALSSVEVLDTDSHGRIS